MNDATMKELIFLTDFLCSIADGEMTKTEMVEEARALLVKLQICYTVSMQRTDNDRKKGG